MKSTYRVLFVCMGNICRSPAGECVFRSLIDSNGYSGFIETDSAGTINFHEGNQPDSRMQATAANRGYNIQGAARQIKKEDFEAFDLIITMDDENFHKVSRIQPAGRTRASVHKFCEFCTEHDDSEVPDPYYGGQAGFEKVLDMMEDGCANLISFAKKQIGAG